MAESEGGKVLGEPDLVSGARVAQIVRDMRDLPSDLKTDLKGLIGE